MSTKRRRGTATQKANEKLQVERKCIISKLKNWHIRVKNGLRFDATVEEVKAIWTRLLDIDLLAEPDDSIDIDRISEMFKEVEVFVEANTKQPDSSSDVHQSGTAPWKRRRIGEPTSTSTIDPGAVELSAETTQELKDAHQMMSLYIEGVTARLNRNEGLQAKIARKRCFTNLTGLLATSMMLGGQSKDSSAVDQLIQRLQPTPDELRFILKKLPVLAKHLNDSTPEILAPVSSNDVHWDKVFTQQKNPLLMVDGYLFYRQKEAKSSDTSYYRCIMSRRSSVKCAVRVSFNANGQVVFSKDRQHSHPPKLTGRKKYPGFND